MFMTWWNILEDSSLVIKINKVLENSKTLLNMGELHIQSPGKYVIPGSVESDILNSFRVNLEMVRHEPGSCMIHQVISIVVGNRIKS